MPSRLALWVALSVVLALPSYADDEPFDLTEVPSPGRTTMVELADVNGDGRADLLEGAFVGVPPEERRWIRLRLQRPDGSFAQEPDLQQPLPPATAVYDVANVSGGPGLELLLLDARGVSILSFEEGGEPRRVTLPVGTTIGAGPDERGFDRLPMTTHAFGPEPWLVVPAIGEAFLFTTSGEQRARVSIGGRSNYFVQPPGPMMAESDIQLFYDSPRLQFGDVDGDGQADVVAAARHEIRVFLRRPDGSFPYEPDRRLWLARVSPEDHVRGSGAVRSQVRDLDADGDADLVIAEISGGILNSLAVSSVFLNREGRWNLDAPDAVFSSKNSVSGIQLLDLDADGRLELLRIRVPLTVFELAEVLLTRAFDAHLMAYGMNGEGRFDREPRFQRKLGLPLDFETSRIRGFIPSFDHDLNADGFPDLLSSGDGSRLEIYLGGPESDYGDRAGEQKLRTEGRVRGGDLDGDGLTDLVIYSTRRVDVPIRLLRNRGTLPGTTPSLRSAEN